MANRPNMLKKIEQKDVIVAAGELVGAVTPAPVTFTGGRMPTGDLGLEALHFHYNGRTHQGGAADGTVIADGQLRYLNSLEIETDNLKTIVDKVGGLALQRMLTWEHGTPPATTQLASNADAKTFSASLPISFLMPKHYMRREDTILDMYADQIRVRAQFGSYTQLISGGNAANGIDLLKADLSAEILPGPLQEAAGAGYELPGWYRYWKEYSFDITGAEADKSLAMTFGKDIIEKVWIYQTDANGVELATVITDEDEISFVVNGTAWTEKMTFKELRDMYKAPQGLESLFTGWACVYDASKKGSILKLLSVVAPGSGTVEVIADVNNIAASKVKVLLQAVRPLPAAAARPRKG